MDRGLGKGIDSMVTALKSETVENTANVITILEPEPSPSFLLTLRTSVHITKMTLDRKRHVKADIKTC